METKDLINSIYALFKLELENEIKVNDNEIIICLNNNETTKIKITKII